MSNRKFLSILACGLLIATLTVAAQYTARDEYTLIGYSGTPRNNPVARLAERLERGELVLEYREERGYLESILDALDIDPSSQMLVYSPTSVQHRLISPATPRALYFTDDMYVGWVQNSHIVEFLAIDDKLGIVFYTFNNRPGPERYIERATQTCLVCHDTQGTMAGGVPMLMALSSVYSDKNVALKRFSGTGNVTDATPIADRWGGWYVTGRHGLQPHLGNILLQQAADLERLNDFRQWNLDTLQGAGFLDTTPYLRPTSDITALLVLEHQITVQNQITYIKFKAPAVLARWGLGRDVDAPTWDALSVEAQQLMTGMLDQLVRHLFFAGAAQFQDRISGAREFEDWFQAQGPRDSEGRSLRDLDLETRLFRFPLSYLVYSSDFDTLPAFAKDYVYRKIAGVLDGQDGSGDFAHLSQRDRRSIREILLSTKPDFVP